jgi:hypothetical protein
MLRTTTAYLTLALVGLTPSLALAEVMDKEPTPSGLWVTHVLLGIVALLAWRRHWVVGAIVTALALGFVWSFHWELADPFVGPAIRLEAGASYVRQAYASMLTCTMLHAAGILGYVFWWRHAGSTPSLSIQTGTLKQ